MSLDMVLFHVLDCIKLLTSCSNEILQSLWLCVHMSLCWRIIHIIVIQHYVVHDNEKVLLNKTVMSVVVNLITVFYS